MLLTSAQVRDGALLQLLADILRPDIDLAATGEMRLRLMHRGFSWQALVDLARGQGVLLPLTFALKARTLLPPIPRSVNGCDSHVTAKLGDIYRQYLARRQWEKQQLQRILRMLAGAGIVPLILKGARYLVDPVAAWCEARAMADFDILLRPGDAERAFALMKADGYQHEAGDVAVYRSGYSHHLPALQHPDQPAALEIHTKPLTFVGQKIMSAQQVWERAVKAGDGSFFVLPASWHALHGLLHHQVQDRGHARRTLNIKALWEWTMLAHRFTAEDWDAITAHMEAAKASNVLDSWLMQSHRLFGLSTPCLRTIPAIAKTHADAALRGTAKPYWLRRTKYIADQLRYLFARETLANRYGVPPSRVSLVHAGKNASDLFRRHRGKVFERLTGYRDQLW